MKKVIGVLLAVTLMVMAIPGVVLAQGDTVTLDGEVPIILGLEVEPGSIPFGTMTPGTIAGRGYTGEPITNFESEQPFALSITNISNCAATMTCEVTDTVPADSTLFKANLYGASAGWKGDYEGSDVWLMDGYDRNLNAAGEGGALDYCWYIHLKVPADAKGGHYTGTMVFSVAAQ